MFFRFLILPILLLVVVAIFLTQNRELPGVEGAGKVIDGRTMVIKAQRVRLFGIDAPELKQNCTHRGKPWPCGREAAGFLAKLVGDRRVTCKQMGRADGYMLGVCSLEGQVINREMVAAGWALASGTESDQFIALERAAQKEAKGIWRGQFTPPWEWRKANE